MAGRVVATARRHGLAGDDAASLGIAFDRIVRERWPAIGDEHHPDHLHTARTALILLDDVGLVDRSALGAALLFDSLNPALVPTAERAASIAGADAAGWLGALPPAGLDEAELIERLVTSDATTLHLALAERLDHARHLHMRDDVDRAAFHAGVTRVYLPLARRAGGPLHARFDRWATAFRRRHLHR